MNIHRIIEKLDSTEDINLDSVLFFYDSVCKYCTYYNRECIEKGIVELEYASNNGLFRICEDFRINLKTEELLNGILKG